MIRTNRQDVDATPADENLVFGALSINPADTLFGQGGISPDQLEALYALAVNHYDAGQYAEADTLFQALCLYKNNDARFWMGLGGCRQARGRLLSAADAYTAAAGVGRFTSPQPLLFMALCLLRVGLHQEAEAVLRGLLDVGDPARPDNAACHEKAGRVLNLLEQRADATGK